MKICEMCNVLFNMSLGLDYADGAGSHKEELDILEVQIFFEITTDNGEDEAEEAFYLKVTDVQEF